MPKMPFRMMFMQQLTNLGFGNIEFLVRSTPHTIVLYFASSNEAGDMGSPLVAGSTKASSVDFKVG